VCCHKDDKVLLDDTTKNNDTKVCCHKDDKVLLDDTKNNNDAKVCCHKDDKVLLDDTKKIMIQKCVVIKMTKYFWMIQKK